MNGMATTNTTPSSAAPRKPRGIRPWIGPKNTKARIFPHLRGFTLVRRLQIVP